jgi:hypothetical protein
MQCQEFEDRLNLLLDERQRPQADPQLAAHAAQCERCCQLLAGQQALLAGLRQWKLNREASPRAAGHFAHRVVAQMKAEPALAVVVDRPRPSRRGWLVAAGLIATAAAVLLTVTITALNSGDGTDVGGAVVLDPDRSPKNSSPTVTPRQPNRSIAADSPAPRTSHRPFQPGALSLFAGPSGGYRAAIADVASNLPEAVERLDEVERYAPGIRPIRVSFTMLLEALWRAIPGLSSDSRSDPGAFHLLLDAGRLV